MEEHVDNLVPVTEREHPQLQYRRLEQALLPVLLFLCLCDSVCYSGA